MTDVTTDDRPPLEMSQEELARILPITAKTSLVCIGGVHSYVKNGERWYLLDPETHGYPSHAEQ